MKNFTLTPDRACKLAISVIVSAFILCAVYIVMFANVPNL